MRGYFERCLPSIRVKKRFREKVVKICEFTRIHAKKCEFGSTVDVLGTEKKLF
jgi:hypothetical protein